MNQKNSPVQEKTFLLIKLHLTQKELKRLDIIARALNVTVEEFINSSIRRESKFIQDTMKRRDFKEDLNSYYKDLEYGQINFSELTKLNLLEETLSGN